MRNLSSLRCGICRVIDDELDLLFPELPAVLLDEPKAIGKTEAYRRNDGVAVVPLALLGP